MSFEINVDDIIYCNVDKLWFYFKKFTTFEYFKEREPFTDRKEIVNIWWRDYEFYVYLKDDELRHWYERKLWFKIEFEKKLYEVIDILYNKHDTRYLCVFHWKLWRFATFWAFKFTNVDLVDFIQKQFTEIQLREIHICLDIRESEDYITRLYDYIKTNVLDLAKKRTFRKNDEGLYGTQIEIGIASKKDNKEYYYKIYNKTTQVKNDKIDNLYTDYCWKEKHVFRYELELRPTVAKSINIEDLKTNGNDWKYVLHEWICRTLISYFWDKQWFQFVFWKLPIEKVKIKRLSNKADGSTWKKIDDFKLLPKLKSLRTQAQNIENITGIPIKDNFDKLDEVIWESQDYRYYITLYKWIFRTIQNHYEEHEVNNFDELSEVIKSATNYAINFLKTDYNNFFKVIRWWINKNSDSVVEFLSNNDNSLVELIYFYYFWRLREWILFDFLDVLKEWNLSIFENYFKSNKQLQERISRKKKIISSLENVDTITFEEYWTEIYNILYLK